MLQAHRSKKDRGECRTVAAIEEVRAQPENLRLLTIGQLLGASLCLQAMLLVGLLLLAFGVSSLSPQAPDFSDALWIAQAS